jgi:hypothetical protein
MFKIKFDCKEYHFHYKFEKRTPELRSNGCRHSCNFELNYADQQIRFLDHNLALPSFDEDTIFMFYLKFKCNVILDANGEILRYEDKFSLSAQ